MVRLPLACIVLVLSTAFGSAEVDVIKQRKSLFKKMGDATKPLAAMLKNRQAFDATLVQEALEAYGNGSQKLPELFPATSKTGEETEAKPVIWTDKAKFEALFKKLHTDSIAAQSGIADEATFRSTMPKLLGDCKECHDTFREKK